MKKISKKILIAILAVVMSIAGVNLMETIPAQAQRWAGVRHLIGRNFQGTAWIDIWERTSVRTTATGATVGEIHQFGGNLQRSVNGRQIADGWTWIQGNLTGNHSSHTTAIHWSTGARTDFRNRSVWIATSQLSHISGGLNSAHRCTIRLGDTAIRHAPAASSVAGARLPSGAHFYPTGDTNGSGSNHTWRLGILIAPGNNVSRTTASNGSGWNGRLVWIATSQLNCP